MPHTNVRITDELSGYLARPQGAGPFPGIVVLMEAFGLKHHIQRACDRLARMGFSALAPDIYHGQVLDYGDMEGVRAKIPTVNDDQVMREVGSALEWLALHAGADHGRLGVLGFCMGGRLAFLTAATHGSRIRAAASFYGGSIAPDEEDRYGRTPPIVEAQHIAGPLFLGYGAEDRGIAPAEHGRIARTLSDLKKRYTLSVYPDAGHGFLCEERSAYAPAAASQAWAEVLDFFGREMGQAL